MYNFNVLDHSHSNKASLIFPNLGYLAIIFQMHDNKLTVAAPNRVKMMTRLSHSISELNEKGTKTRYLNIMFEDMTDVDYHEIKLVINGNSHRVRFKYYEAQCIILFEVQNFFMEKPEKFKMEYRQLV